MSKLYIKIEYTDRLDAVAALTNWEVPFELVEIVDGQEVVLDKKTEEDDYQSSDYYDSSC